MRTSRRSIVTDGLQAGERVVVDGASRLTDRPKVTVAQPSASPAAAPAGPDRPRAPAGRAAAGARPARAAT